MLFLMLYLQAFVPSLSYSKMTLALILIRRMQAILFMLRHEKALEDLGIAEREDACPEDDRQRLGPILLAYER